MFLVSCSFSLYRRLPSFSIHIFISHLRHCSGGDYSNEPCSKHNDCNYPHTCHFALRRSTAFFGSYEEELQAQYMIHKLQFSSSHCQLSLPIIVQICSFVLLFFGLVISKAAWWAWSVKLKLKSDGRRSDIGIDNRNDCEMRQEVIFSQCLKVATSGGEVHDLTCILYRKSYIWEGGGLSMLSVVLLA